MGAHSEGRGMQETGGDNIMKQYDISRGLGEMWMR